MRFSMILEMVDRLSGPARRARGGVRGLGDNIRQMGQRIRQAAGQVRSGERSLEHFARRARRLRQLALGRIFQAIGSSVRGVTRNLGNLIGRLRLVERAGRAAGAGLRKLGGAGLGMLKNGLFAGGAAAVGAGGFALFDLFSTAGQFEQYQAMLEGTEGSVEAAKATMGWVRQFAEKTPFELGEVMESFIKLKGYGLDPMNGSLLALGEGAAGMSLPLMQAAEAMGDAVNGSFERLQEFSIRASKAGDKVTFSYGKNGKQIQRTAKDNAAEIEKTLAAIFNDRFAGGMERQSKTFFGLIANMKDKWAEFLVMVADAGIFDMVKKDLEGLLSRVNEMAKSGELKKWAEEISDRLQKAWKWGQQLVANTDWDAVGRDLRNIGEAVKIVADAILELKRVKDNFGGWTMLSPISTLFAGARSMGIGDGMKGLRGSLAPAAKPAAPGSAATRLPSDNDLVRRALGKQASLTLSGGLKIDVSGAPGLAVRATPVAAPGSNLPMEVRTGRAMRGSA